jgi:hypothetical protein
VTSRKAARLRHRSDDVEALELDGIAGPVGTIATSIAQSTQIIRAVLIGSNDCVAFGIIATGHAPVLALTRLLIEAGHDPATPLEAWRGSILALRIRAIGDAAELEISRKGAGFIRRRAVGTAPPIAQNLARVSGTAAAEAACADEPAEMIGGSRV